MPLSRNLETFFFLKKIFSRKREKKRRRTGETEPADTQDTTRLVEIEELKRAIRALLFVTKLSRVDAHKDKAAGWGATLKCASCPGCCGKKQEPPVQLSRDRKSELACLQELLKRLQDRHVDCAEALAQKAAADKVTRDLTDSNVQTPSGRITSALETAQHLRATFCTPQWPKKHKKNMKINKVVVMYLDTGEIVLFSDNRSLLLVWKCRRPVSGFQLLCGPSLLHRPRKA